tara:strand:+ start:102 stop:527 length:426 start_codon:yes stop_codon:yes gene_type:complete
MHTVVILSNKWSLRFSNYVGIVKVGILILYKLPPGLRVEHLVDRLSISITGFVVLGGGVKSIPDPGVNFRNAFEGTTGDASGIVRALVRVNYAYEGYANAFNVVNEIKVRLLPSLCSVYSLKNARILSEQSDGQDLCPSSS